MKTFQVVLAKSYVVTVKASSEEKAKRVAEFYTGDILDISTARDRKQENFSILEIECGMNESFEAEEVE